MGSTTYEGETRLAIGGMAEVMMAVEWNAGGVPSLVVLKRLLEHLADDAQTVDDFLNEARMMVALHHSNIVSVRDLGRDQTGFYIVQEYLSGVDLRSVLKELDEREMTMPVPIACRVAAEVAAALQYAHRAADPQGQPMKLVHRDINPGNVVLTFDGRVKLIDFGVARSSLRRQITQPGAVKGQPAYVAPETYRGEAVDHRADIFSLGVVLYEMLTGRSLFQRQNPAAVLEAILHEPLASTRELNPQVPEALDAAVMVALDRDPNRRFPSAGQMREALEEVLRSVNLPVGPRQLAGWVQTSMADARRVRIELERAVRKKAGVSGVRGSTSVVTRIKPPVIAPSSRTTKSSGMSPVAVASLLAFILLLLVIAAFLVGRSAAGGPGTAGT
ncbi:MAG: serine/threonine-protein kinase [Myxococcota bacterium]